MCERERKMRTEFIEFRNHLFLIFSFLNKSEKFGDELNKILWFFFHLEFPKKKKHE